MSLAPQNLVDKKWTTEISLTQPEMRELHVRGLLEDHAQGCTRTGSTCHSFHG
jgi:hypothetical protein